MNGFALPDVVSSFIFALIQVEVQPAEAVATCMFRRMFLLRVSANTGNLGEEEIHDLRMTLIVIISMQIWIRSPCSRTFFGCSFLEDPF